MLYLLLLSLISTVAYTSVAEPAHIVVEGPVSSVVTQSEIRDQLTLIAGYIEIDGNDLYVDEVEVITMGDQDRIKQLGLKDGDMPNGYFIYNLSTEKTTYELTDETVYTFTDFNLLYVKEADGDRKYRTTEREHFIEHLNTSYSDHPPASNVPFFIEVKEGTVISITEEFLFTQ